MFFDDKAQEKDEAHIEKDNQEEIAAKHNLNGAVSTKYLLTNSRHLYHNILFLWHFFGSKVPIDKRRNYEFFVNN